MNLLRTFATTVSRSCIALILFLCVTSLRAEESDLEKALRQYNAQTVSGYIQPIADLFGANLNAGFSHSANIPSGFHIRLDIVAMGAVVSDEETSYNAKDPWGGEFKTATVLGGKGSTVSFFPNDPSLQYKGSDGIFNTSFFPFATPQITVGSVYGTEAILRYVPIPEDFGGAKLPAITLFGIGARHSLSQYIEGFPLDVATSFMYNKFTIGDLITANATAFGVQASKEFSILQFYGGLQYEKTSMTLEFNSTDPTVTSPLVSIDLDGSNNVRATIGAALNLYVLKVFADANFGNVTNFSAGIGFGF